MMDAAELKKRKKELIDPIRDQIAREETDRAMKEKEGHRVFRIIYSAACGSWSLYTGDLFVTRGDPPLNVSGTLKMLTTRHQG
jgi:hypothetical protein